MHVYVLNYVKSIYSFDLLCRISLTYYILHFG